MRVAIDIGCWPGGFDSIRHLIKELKVDRVFGFDPHPDTPVYAGDEIDGALVWTYRQAASDKDGTVGWRQSGWGSYTTNEPGATQVPSIDIAEFVMKLLRAQDEKQDEVNYLAMKLDCEGDEFPILRHLIATGVIETIDLLWVEWHGNDPTRHELEEWITENTECEIAEWTL